MVLCSELANHQCKIIPTPTILFEDYHSCIVYGYSYSHRILTEFDPEWVNSMEVYTKFSCKVDKVI